VRELAMMAFSEKLLEELQVHEREGVERRQLHHAEDLLLEHHRQDHDGQR
jgi:hypothetical protein